MKKFIFLLIFSISTLLVSAQIPEPVEWSATIKNIEDNRYLITFKVKIEEPFHIYDMGPYENGPIVTKFTFEKSDSIEFIGSVKAVTPATKEFDESFGIEIGQYEGEASFTQEFKTSHPDAKIKVAIEWQACGNGLYISA